MNNRIGFIGAGNMAGAIIHGLLHSNTVLPTNIIAADPSSQRLEHIKRDYGVAVTSDNTEAARSSDVVIIAVKPAMVAQALRSVESEINSKLVISIAAGVPILNFERLLPDARVIRAMPNTPALIRAATTALAMGKQALEDDLVTAKNIFDSIGLTVVVEESQLDAITGLSGSGPAYVFMIIEALADAGVKMGLSRQLAQQIAAQTVMGSAKLQIETNAHPATLKDQVASPGGTTIAAIHALEAGGLRATLINAVEAATRRSRELGSESTLKDCQK